MIMMMVDDTKKRVSVIVPGQMDKIDIGNRIFSNVNFSGDYFRLIHWLYVQNNDHHNDD